MKPARPTHSEKNRPDRSKRAAKPRPEREEPADGRAAKSGAKGAKAAANRTPEKPAPASRTQGSEAQETRKRRNRTQENRAKRSQAQGSKVKGSKAKGNRERGNGTQGKITSQAEAASALEPMRIAKYLARAGHGSRRDVERMIGEGRVAVDGSTLASPALNVTGAERIEVDGRPVAGIERTRLWLYHKPSGLLTTNRDPEGRPTVFATLPDTLPRVVSVGRLDFNTEGLLLLTNDGGLARLLELPSTGWLRRYRVRAHGRVTQEQLDALREGVAVDGVLYGAVEAEIEREQGANVWLVVGIREGKNREVKRVLAHIGLDVNRLIRVSYGPFQLAELKPGEVKEVRGRVLRDQLGERLLAEAGANFDAPLIERKPKPVDHPGKESASKHPARRGPVRAKASDRPETGRSKKPRARPKPTRNAPDASKDRKR